MGQDCLRRHNPGSVALDATTWGDDLLAYAVGRFATLAGVLDSGVHTTVAGEMLAATNPGAGAAGSKRQTDPAELLRITPRAPRAPVAAVGRIGASCSSGEAAPLRVARVDPLSDSTTLPLSLAYLIGKQAGLCWRRSVALGLFLWACRTASASSTSTGIKYGCGWPRVHHIRLSWPLRIRLPRIAPPNAKIGILQQRRRDRGRREIRAGAPRLSG